MGRGLRLFLILTALAILAGQESTTVRAAPLDREGLASNDGVLPLPSVDPDHVITADGEYLRPFTGTGATSSATTTEAENLEAESGYPADGESDGYGIIVGSDDRTRVKNHDQYPWSAVVFLDTSRGYCSGWMAGKDTVVTAGHCLYNRVQGWVTSARAFPGRDFTRYPFGYCNATRLYVLNGWFWYQESHYDVGFVQLGCNIGRQSGWLGSRTTTGNVHGAPTRSAGYPWDKTYGTMWRADGHVNGGADPCCNPSLGYTNDTRRGQSGSAIWNGIPSCSPCTIATHAYSECAPNSNCGPRITQRQIRNIRDIRNS
jgi:glutamyl endopeptidase